jgi:hypothetical protein
LSNDTKSDDNEPASALEPVDVKDPILASQTQKIKPTLNPEERQQALTSVRDRLAKIRAERAATGENGKPEVKKSYMFPTASSVAKSVDTNRTILNVTERKKIRERIEGLRRTSEVS